MSGGSPSRHMFTEVYQASIVFFLGVCCSPNKNKYAAARMKNNDILNSFSTQNLPETAMVAGGVK